MTASRDAPFDVSSVLDDLRLRARARLPQRPPERTIAKGPAALGDFSLGGTAPAAEWANARAAAVLVPIVARRPPTVLLTERATGLRHHSGQIAFPGGKIDDPEESALDAALRETREEIGLDPGLVEPIGYLEPYLTGTGFRIVPVVAIVTPPFELTLNPTEVAAAFETPLSFLMAPANHQKIERKTDGRRFYAMPFENRYIWGATAGMIRHLYETLYL